MPQRSVDAHKGNFGRVLMVGGSRGMSGAISLSALAALRCGSGLVTAAVPDRCLETVASFHPCIMTMPIPDCPQGTFSIEAASSLAHVEGYSAVGCGPGMTTGPGSLRLVERLLHAREVPRVIDADAINAMAILHQPADVGLDDVGPMVLTPHPGEFQRLTGVAAAQRTAQIEAAQALTRGTEVVVVLKGGPSVIVSGAQCWTNTTGNPGMATAGSGDVLTGVITSLLGQGISVWDAACLGCWIHGTAGDLAAAEHGFAGLTAVEILDQLPQAVRRAE